MGVGDRELDPLPTPHKQTGSHGGGDHRNHIISSSSPSSSSNNNNADPERLQQYIRTFERAIKEVGVWVGDVFGVCKAMDGGMHAHPRSRSPPISPTSF